MSRPTVSILTPTYNHEKYISECLESVLSQTFRDWELIVVDDRSTDRTAEKVARIAEKDARVRLVRHASNWGMRRLADTHNEALSLCGGEFVALLEGDDRWAPFKLELQVSMMRSRPEAVLCHTGGALTGGKAERTISFARAFEKVRENRPVGRVFRAFLMGVNPIISQTVMIRRSALERIGGFQPKDGSLFLVDYPTWMHLALLGEFAYVPQVLGYWRQHSAQITASHDERLVEDQLTYIDTFLRAHAGRLLELDKGLAPLVRDPGYAALCHLLTIRLNSGKIEEARKTHDRIARMRSKLPLTLADHMDFFKKTMRVRFSGAPRPPQAGDRP